MIAAIQEGDALSNILFAMVVEATIHKWTAGYIGPHMSCGRKLIQYNSFFINSINNFINTNGKYK